LFEQLVEQLKREPQKRNGLHRSAGGHGSSNCLIKVPTTEAARPAKSSRRSFAKLPIPSPVSSFGHQIGGETSETVLDSNS
jgi:hypothetical protein